MNLRLLMFGVLVLAFDGRLLGQQSVSRRDKSSVSPRSAQQKTVTSGPVAQLLREALAAYRAGQLSEALGKLEKAYQQAPGNAEVRLLLGLLLYENDSASYRAQQLMESVADQFLTNAELQLKLLDSYLQLKSESKPALLLHKLQGKMAGNLRFAFDVIYTLVRYGQLEMAQKQVDMISAQLGTMAAKLTEQDLKLPTHQTLMHNLGEVDFVRGMIAASREEKSEAMRLFQAADVHDFPARNSLQMQMLAEALFRLQEYRLGIQAYEEYLKYFPLDVGARGQLAMGYYTTASFARAEQNFKKAIEGAPETEHIHLYFGLTLLELKKNEDARREFQAELKVDPHSYQAMAELAYLAYLDGDNEACGQWLEKAQQLNPDWVETNMVYGLLCNRLGQFERAIQFLERAVKENPSYSRAHYQLSLAYRRSGNEAKAKEHAETYDRLTAEEKSRQLGDRAPKN